MELEPVSCHFATTLNNTLARTSTTVESLRRQLNAQGIAVESSDIRTWLRGEPCPQWDRVLPALEGIFGLPRDLWVADRAVTRATLKRRPDGAVSIKFED